jgi:hypothetical protein
MGFLKIVSMAIGLIFVLVACESAVNKRGRSTFHGTQPSLQYGEECEFGDPEFYCGIRYGP